MKYFVDGWLIGKNPSKEGGGFTLVDEHNNFIMRKVVKRENFTNNDAELLGMYFAINHAKPHDTIATDSLIVYWWVKTGKTKSKKGIDQVLQDLQKKVLERCITLKWVRRESNLAGIYNEINAKDYAVSRNMINEIDEKERKFNFEMAKQIAWFDSLPDHV